MRHFIFSLTLISSLFLLINDSLGRGSHCGPEPYCPPNVLCNYVCTINGWIDEAILCPDAGIGTHHYTCPNNNQTQKISVKAGSHSANRLPTCSGVRKPSCPPNVLCFYVCVNGTWVDEAILCPDADDNIHDPSCPNYPTGKTNVKVYTDPVNLLENTPNPFENQTFIRYQLAKETQVSLTIYNNMGQEVAQLLQHKQQTPGVHEIPFQGDGLAVGIYYYRLSGAGKVLNGKMMKIQ